MRPFVLKYLQVFIQKNVNVKSIKSDRVSSMDYLCIYEDNLTLTLCIIILLLDS